MQKPKFSSIKSGRMALMLATAAVSIGVSGSALAGIAATKHNLSTSQTGTNNKANTTQICVFCHTPHGADTTGAVPLWNKGASAAVYTTYANLGSPTIEGKMLDVGSVSLACLSCHDGTQAMDNMINSPGSGGYNATGTSAALTWSGARQTAGKITGIAALGSDLSNDHPIGIQYCGGGISEVAAAVSGTCTDGDFHLPTGGTIGSAFAFWVDIGTAGNGRQKTDIPLYARDFTSAGGAGVGPSVECGSCHDPHVDSLTTDQLYFMRVTTAGSAICLACHNK